MPVFFVDYEDIKLLEGITKRIGKELDILQDRPIGIKNRAVIDDVLDDVAIMRTILDNIKRR